MPERIEAVSLGFVKGAKLVEDEQIEAWRQSQADGPRGEMRAGAGMESIGRNERFVAFGPRSFLDLVEELEPVAVGPVWDVASARSSLLARESEEAADRLAALQEFFGELTE